MRAHRPNGQYLLPSSHHQHRVAVRMPSRAVSLLEPVKRNAGREVRSRKLRRVSTHLPSPHYSTITSATKSTICIANSGDIVYSFHLAGRKAQIK